VRVYQVNFQRLFARKTLDAEPTSELGLHAALVGHVPGHVLFVLVAPAAHVWAVKPLFPTDLVLRLFRVKQCTCGWRENA